MTDSTHFVCVPIQSTRLTPRACGERHRVAKLTAQGRMPRNGARLWAGDCARCLTGAAHARGMVPELWEDGTPIVRLSLTPHGATPIPKPAPVAIPTSTATHQVAVGPRPKPPKPAKVPTERPNAERPPAQPRPKKPSRATLYEHDGRAMSLPEWARDPDVIARGITQTTLHWRVRCAEPRWPIGRALTEPPGATYHRFTAELHVEVRPEVREALEATARERGIHLSVLVREILDAHLSALTEPPGLGGRPPRAEEVG